MIYSVSVNVSCFCVPLFSHTVSPLVTIIGYSCGIFVAMYAYFLSLNLPLEFGQKHIGQLRQHMALILNTNSTGNRRSINPFPDGRIPEESSTPDNVHEESSALNTKFSNLSDLRDGVIIVLEFLQATSCDNKCKEEIRMERIRWAAIFITDAVHFVKVNAFLVY